MLLATPHPESPSILKRMTLTMMMMMKYSNIFAKGEGCMTTSKQKVSNNFQATRWAEHVVLQCNEFDTLKKWL
jgi:hypothetical protein